MTEEKISCKKKPGRFTCLHVSGIMLVMAVAVALLTAWWIKHNIYASMFRPTQLSVKEQKVLDLKLEQLERSGMKEERSFPPAGEIVKNTGRLQPEVYKEDDARREIRLTEKELNSLIAKDEEIARRVAIDLSDDLVSVKLLIPMDKDIPVVGGKTLRLNCGVTLSYEAGRPVVAIRGVSVGGVPLPAAWWGDIKNTNLVEKFGDEGGFWDLFSEGVENIKVREGHFLIKLKK